MKDKQKKVEKTINIKRVSWQEFLAIWVIMTLCICAVTALMRRRSLVLPMEKMCEAAMRVAEGDFSVYISPMRKDGKKDDV